MEYTFYNCSSLKFVNLSNFKANNYIDMKYMFSYCKSLNKLDIYNFNVNNNIDMYNKVLNWNNLKKFKYVKF